MKVEKGLLSLVIKVKRFLLKIIRCPLTGEYRTDKRKLPSFTAFSGLSFRYIHFVYMPNGLQWV